MSGASQNAVASATENAHSDKASVRPGLGGFGPPMAVIAGGLITSVLLVSAVLSVRTGQPAAAELDAVAKDQLDAAVLSLTPSASRVAIEEARQCKTPLAFVTVVAAPGAAPATIRIRSGSYQSPQITVTNEPRRVAVPFPAPYPTGNGVLFVEGAGRGLTLWLNPVWRVGTLNGIAQINVRWTPKNPC